MFQGTGALAFNATFYLQNNPDVAVAVGRGQFTSALDHFIQFGQFEFRDPNAFFDTEYYLQTNPDVLAAIADPANPSVVSAFQHFVDFGSEEGVVRAPSAEFASFTEAAYLAANPDVAAAVAAGQFENGFEHFLTFGVNEVRPGSGVVLQPENPGQQFDLTVLANDNLVGTAGDDTFVGTAATIQATDRINGGSGFDTFVNIGSAGTVSGAGPVLPILTNIEQVVFQGPAAGITADYSANASLERLVINNANTANSLTVASGVTVGFDDVGSGSQTQTVNFKGATNGTIEVSNGSALGAVTVAGSTASALTSLTIASTGAAANTIASIAQGTGLTTVNITGDQDVSIGGLGTRVTTINAAEATGDVTVVVPESVGTDGTTAAGTTITGGAGDDTFIFADGTFTTKDIVNGGAGFDAVSVETGGGALAADTVAAFNALKSVEQAIFTGTGVTLDGKTFTNTEITSIQFNTTGSDVVDAAGSARTYSIGEANTGDLTLNMKAGATVANVELDGTASVGDNAAVGTLTVNLNAADLASKATINITSLESATATATSPDLDNTITTITAITGSTANITGAGDITIGGLTNAATVNASALTGELTLTGSTGVDTITTGAGNSFITAGAGADLITLGSGVDTLNFAAAGHSGIRNVDATTSAVTYTSVDVITGFQAGVGGDVLNQVAGADRVAYDGLTVDQLNSVAGAATLDAAITLALTATTGDAWTAFSFGGTTYALYDGGDPASGTETFDNATDFLVQLNGVSVSALTLDNFA